MEQEAAPVVQSQISWIMNSLGPMFTVGLAVAGLLSLVLTLLVVARGKGPLAGAALWLAVTLPLWVGAFGFFQGAISSFTVIAMAETQVKPSEVAAGISVALVTPFVGLMMMAPSFLLALLGALIRSMAAGREDDA